MEKDYFEIHKICKEKELDKYKLKIASTVDISLQGKEYSKEDYNALCSLINDLYLDIDYGDLTIISDIICDLTLNLGYGYRKSYEGENLTLEKINHLSSEEYEAILTFLQTALE